MELHKQYVATAYVYDRQSDRFLLIWHRKLGKWLAPGGHLLPGEEPHRGALRELLEETGLEGRVVDIRSTPDVNTSTVAQLPSPFCILAEPIPGSAKEEDHLHLDFVYVLEVDPLAPLTPLADEVDHAVWIDGGHIDELDTFENVRRVCQAIRILSHQNTETSF